MVYGREALILGGVFFVAVLTSRPVWKQEWKLVKSNTPGQVSLEVSRSSASGYWAETHDVPAGRVASLDRMGPVKFEYVQDAGTLLCEGRVFLGHGSGAWTFRPNPEFAASLRQLGYTAPDSDQQLSMLQAGVTLQFAKGLKDAGIRADTEDLLDLRRHGITLERIRDVREAGYRDLTAADFIDLKSHGVNLDFMRALQAAGYNLPAAQMIQLQARVELGHGDEKVGLAGAFT